MQFSKCDGFGLKEIPVKFNFLFGSVTTGFERKGFSSFLYCEFFFFSRK